MQTPIRLAVDIGGTFTDLQIQDYRTGSVHDFKSPTTPDDPSRGLINAIVGASERFGFGLGDIGMILHGSTIATNAVLERKLPKGALITTQGFEDVLEIGRHMRQNVYALRAEARSVLIPRQFRLGVPERIRADGTVEVPLDRGAVREAGHRLLEAGVSAVAIVFLHAYRNPSHELAAAEVLAGLPGLAVATSHEASPEIREYERSSTTVLNALLMPVISNYLTALTGRLRDQGIGGKLYLVQSNGGVASAEEAARLPAKLLLSGPAGGAMAMAGLARRHDLPNVVGLDMGGTSADVSVVVDGRVGETGEGMIDGLPVRLPMVEIRTIGAGGGSIARCENRAMRVGPHSAGSAPGPACYGRGGSEPTVTDANLVLGRIDAGAFLGGEMTLDVAAAQAATRSVGEPLSLGEEETADGIVHIASAGMANAVRLSLFEKGADPSDFTLAPFGGAAGLHACAVASELDIRSIIFPARASTLSAGGILTTDLRHDFSHSELILVGPASVDLLATIVGELSTICHGRLDQDDVAAGQRTVLISADMRYRGQAYEINTPWTQLGLQGAVDSAALDGLIAAFHALHLSRYAHNSPGDPVEIVTVRAMAIGILEKPTLQDTPEPERTDTARSRRVNIEGIWQDVPVIDRTMIGAEELFGPLIVEEDYSVLLIAGGWSLKSQGQGDLIATRSEKEAS